MSHQKGSWCIEQSCQCDQNAFCFHSSNLLQHCGVCGCHKWIPSHRTSLSWCSLLNKILVSLRSIVSYSFPLTFPLVSPSRNSLFFFSPSSGWHHSCPHVCSPKFRVLGFLYLFQLICIPSNFSSSSPCSCYAFWWNHF